MTKPPLLLNLLIGSVALALWWNGPAIDDVFGNIINTACGLGGLLNILYVTVNIMGNPRRRVTTKCSNE